MSFILEVSGPKYDLVKLDEFLQINFVLTAIEEGEPRKVSFSDEEDLNHIKKAVKREFPSLNPKIVEIEDKNWCEAWKEHFKSFKVGPFGIRSVEHEPFDPPVKYELLMEVEMAFGVGTHETTRLCLEWISSQEFEGLKVLDLGCGTGILGIATKKLGAKEVFAVDNDPIAILATKNNMEKNSVHLEVRESTKGSDMGPFDMILANIELHILESLCKEITRLLKPRAKVLFSGLLVGQHRQLLKSFPDAQVLKYEFLGEWESLVVEIP